MKRQAIFLCFGMSLFFGALGGCSCCEWRADRLEPVPDHLQSYVIVAFGAPPKCPLPWQDKPLLTNRGRAVSLWVRVVHADQILTPESMAEVRFVAVNEFGEVVTGASQYSGTAISDDRGFAILPSYVPKDLGSFRIRVDYGDRFGSASSYSAPIIVN